MRKRNPASPTSSRPGNRRRPFSPARKLATLAARCWPVWLALATAAAVFTSLSRPVAARHSLLRQAASLPGEIAWVERALASAAISQNSPPAGPIAAETWRAHLDPRAPEPLRLQATDAFGHPFGPQAADRPVRLHPSSIHLLNSLHQPPPLQHTAPPSLPLHHTDANN